MIILKEDNIHTLVASNNKGWGVGEKDKGEGVTGVQQERRRGGNIRKEF